MDHDPNATTAVDIFTKFNFYKLTLTFGILALSIETADFSGPLVSRVAELVGWGLFLGSGVTGLNRVEGLPGLYHLIATQGTLRKQLHQLSAVQADIVGVTSEQKEYKRQDLIDRDTQGLAEAEKNLTGIEPVARRQYRIQRATFLAGLVALAIARGAGPFLRIVQEVRLLLP